MRLPDGRIRKLRRSREDPGCAHELTFSCYRGLPLLGRDRTRRWFAQALDRARHEHQLELWAYVIMPEHVHILFVPLDPEYRIGLVLQSIKQPPMRRAINWLKRNNPAWLERHLRASGDEAKSENDPSSGGAHGLASPGAPIEKSGILRTRPDHATPSGGPDHGTASPGTNRAGRSKRAYAPKKPAYHFWQPGGGYDRNVNKAESAWEIVDYIHENPVKRGLVEHPADWPWSSARWYLGEGEVVLPMDACPPRRGLR